eukprot:TRINITY_DN3340_c0_g1_i1.p1 TRINITY_DN3340_c0_g1~~TRINITY_DN3340_c0_g1_i1.p1  ORF type:complete len:1265 (+),score=200.56 TRINITY_DN3340_c0_g1_i1:200-3994(+)
MRFLKLSLAEAVMVMCVVIVAITGLTAGLMTLSAMQIALDETHELGTRSVDQCFLHGTETVDKLLGELVVRAAAEVDLFMTSSHLTSEQTSTFAARLIQRGPPAGISYEDWIEHTIRPQLAAMSHVSSSQSQNRLGVVMPPRTPNSSRGLQLDNRDFLMFLSNPLSIELSKSQEIRSVIERTNETTQIGTIDSSGRIIADTPCNVDMLFEDPTPPGSGACKIAPMFGTLLLGNFPFIGYALTTAPIMSQTWSIVDSPYGQMSMICAIPFMLDGQRGVAFSGISILRSSSWIQEVISSLPGGSRLYAFYQADDGVRYLLSSSHGEPIKRNRYPASVMGFQPFRGSIEEHSRLRCDEAEDDVIREHCSYLVQSYPVIHQIPRLEIWNGSNSEYITATEHVGDGQGLVLHTVTMINRPIALRDFIRKTEAIELEITERSSIIDTRKTRGITIMAMATTLVMLLLAQIAAFFSSRITRPLGVFRKEMEAVARMELDAVVDTSSRFTEIRAMQAAFSIMVDNLRVYKAYMPAAVFVPVDEQGKTPVSGSTALTNSTTSLGESSLQNSGGANTNGTKTINMLTNNKRMQSGVSSAPTPTVGLTTTMNMTLTSTCQTDAGSHPLSHLLQIGLRNRKGTVFTIDYNLYSSTIQGDTPSDENDDLLPLLSMILSTVRSHSGIVLSFTPYRMVATWNIHSSVLRHAPSACRCAFVISDGLKSAEPKVKSPWAMALDTGLVKAGVAGDKSTKSPVCVGPPIDFTSWVALLGPIIGTRILGSGELVDRVRKHVDARVVDVVYTTPSPSSCNSTRDSTFVYELRGPLRSTQAVSAQYTEGFSAFTKKDFKRARHQLQNHLRTNCDDYQASRLLRLAIHAERNGLTEQKGHHYTRRVLGWESYESAAADVTLPEGVTRVLKSQNDMLLSTRNDDSHDDAESLRKEIQSALESRCSNSESGTTPRKGSLQSTKENQGGVLTSTMMTLTTMNAASLTFGDVTGASLSQLPAKEFTDRSNVTWYRSDRMLGKGAYGTVWVGMSDSGEQVALKSLPLNIGGTDEEISNLLNEVKMLSTLRNENLVSYVTSAVAGGHVFIGIELMPGGSVAGLLKEFTSLPPNVVLRYTRDMVRGLRYLHMKSVIHRDLKPANILLLLDGTCKLADFGASLFLQKIGQDGKSMGTPLYMSPEACKGKACYASDIWSLGITVYEMLSGDLPYSPESRMCDAIGFTFQVAQKRLKPTFSPSLPKDALSFLNSCVEYDPDLRTGAAGLLTHPYLLK